MKLTKEIRIGFSKIIGDIADAILDLQNPRKNVQVVVLMTDDGTAPNEEELKAVWQKRLQQASPPALHYTVVSACIVKRRKN